MFSVMMTAPSTMMPKSMAPRESRLAGICPQVHEDEREEQGEGNGHGHDEGGPDVVEKEGEEHDNERPPLRSGCA